ncbi:unnamed protein product [Boreogadus saida]
MLSVKYHFHTSRRRSTSPSNETLEQLKATVDFRAAFLHQRISTDDNRHPETPRQPPAQCPPTSRDPNTPSPVTSDIHRPPDPSDNRHPETPRPPLVTADIQRPPDRPQVSTDIQRPPDHPPVSTDIQRPPDCPQVSTDIQRPPDPERPRDCPGVQRLPETPTPSDHRHSMLTRSRVQYSVLLATGRSVRGMAEPELLLDSNIRLWVVLPIVFITFLVGIIRHYVSILLQSDKKLTLEQVSDSQVLIRSRILRENGKYIPKQSFLMRKFYFNNQDDGFFKKSKRKVIPPSPMTDPSMLTDMMKGNVTNVLPMILIGGWINWTFSGFVTTKVPFPLTLRFKPMLQQGVELLSLDASWVSSASWYFLNVFGLRSMYSLILGQDNGADQSRIMQEQMSGAAMAMPADTNKAFKAEWEALELTDHQWALDAVEEELMGRELDFDGMFSKDLPTGIF